MNHSLLTRGANAIIRRASNYLFQKTKSERILKGPWGVQLSVSDVCNSTCIMCWMNSPLLRHQNIERATLHREQMSFKLAQRCIDELHKNGTRGIYFTGRGEPLLNNKLTEIIKHAKSRGMYCQLTTNGTFLSEKKINELIDSELDSINISIHAGTPDTYKKIHSAFKDKTFYHIREMLNYMYEAKSERSACFPEVEVNYVISKINSHEIEEMIKCAIDYHASQISFIPVWTCETLYL